MEIWKSIKGYEDKYQVSNFGRVKSLKRVVPHKLYGTKVVPERFLKAYLRSHGYYCISLWNNNSKTDKYIHRLLAIYFITNPNNYPCINHIDGNKTNNSINNLEWCTIKQNNEHSYANGLNSLNRKIKVCSYTTNECVIYRSIRQASININKNPDYLHVALKRNKFSNNEYHWELV